MRKNSMSLTLISLIFLSNLFGVSAPSFAENDSPIQWSANGHYYQFFKQRVTWIEAQEIAGSSSFQGLTGHLVTVDSSEEESYLKQTVGVGDTWTAGRDIYLAKGANRIWAWADGPSRGKIFSKCDLDTCTSSESAYSNWAANEPNNPTTEPFVQLTMGGFANRSGDSTGDFIVEYELDSEGWGINQTGQIQTGQTQTVSVGGEGHICAIDNSDTATCYGRNWGPFNVPNAKTIDAGAAFECAVDNLKRVVCGGYDWSGVVGFARNVENAIDVSAGGGHACALLEGGNVECWGSDFEGQVSGSPYRQSWFNHKKYDFHDVVQVSSGEHTTCILHSSGRAECWGANGSGQTSVPRDMGLATSVEVGTAVSCATLKSRKLRCWGDVNLASQISQDRQFKKISLAMDAACGIQVSGLIECWGDSRKTPIQIPNNLGLLSDISVGQTSFSQFPTFCATSINGKVTCWGADNYQGAQALNSSTSVKSPRILERINFDQSNSADTTLRKCFISGIDCLLNRAIEIQERFESINYTIQTNSGSSAYEISGAGNLIPGTNHISIKVYAANGDINLMELTLKMPSFGQKKLQILGGNATQDHGFGTEDEYLAISADDGKSWRAAYLNSGHPWGTVESTNAWINCASNLYGCPIRNNFIVRAQFTLGESFGKVTLESKSIVDDFGYLYVNGHLLQNSRNTSNVQGQLFDLSEYVHSGVNTIDTTVIDTGGLAGLNFKFDLLALNCDELSIVKVPYTFPDSISPYLENAPAEGQYLSVNPGIWPTGTRISYQWLSDGSEIPNATDSKYLVTSKDVGSRLSARVTAAGDRYETKTIATTSKFVRGFLPMNLMGTSHYYQYVPFDGSWGDAMSQARTKVYQGMHGHLATVSNSAENSFIANMADGNNIWLAAHVQNSADGRFIWKWSDGPEAGMPISDCSPTRVCSTPVNSFSNWDTAFNQPDLAARGGQIRFDQETALAMSGGIFSPGAWHDCAEASGCTIKGYVVEFEQNYNNSDAEIVKGAGARHYYRIVNRSVDYAEAQKMASESDYLGIPGHLLTLENQDEVSFVANNVGKSNVYWVAAKDLASSSVNSRSWAWDAGPSQESVFAECDSDTSCKRSDGGNNALLVSNSRNTVLQSGRYWEQFNDCSPTLRLCSQITSFIIEYELDTKKSVVDKFGNWMTVLGSDQNIFGSKFSVRFHSETPESAKSLKVSGVDISNAITLDANGNGNAEFAIPQPGSRKITFTTKNRKISLNLWTSRLAVSSYIAKVGKPIKMYIFFVKPGTRCSFAVAGQSMVQYQVAGSAGKCLFEYSTDSPRGVVAQLTAGTLVFDTVGLTFRK